MGNLFAINIGGIIGITIAGVVVLLLVVMLVVSRYKKCPSDKVMVIYGAVGKTKDGSAKCRGTFARTQTRGYSRLGKGHNFGSAPFGYRTYGHRGNQLRQR